MEAKVYEELEEVRLELEELKEEYKRKTELHLTLKRAHDDQVIKLQEANLQIVKQSKEICVKSEEACEAHQFCEELKAKFSEKDFIVRQLSSANEKIRAGWEEKVTILERSNRELVLALDDAMDKNKVLKYQLCVKNEETEGLKALLLATERKCFEGEKRAQMSNESRHEGELIARLEDESRNVQDQLKWKNEQFNHLQEAHEKLHAEFRLSILEWENERLEFINKISSLQSSLDSETRISSNLKTKLKMCNQALAREDSKRKLVQLQLCEVQARFENIQAKCQEEQGKFDKLITDRDKEIATLRDLLAEKDILLKEMEFRILELIQQKGDIHGPLKEFQEAEIQCAGSVKTLKMLQKKLQNLELVHGSCSTNLELKTNEWTSQHERLQAEAREYLSELKKKETQIYELHKELELCRFSLLVLNEEMTVVTMILKSEYSEAYLKLLVAHESVEHKESFIPIRESKATDLVEIQLKNVQEDHKNMVDESQIKQPHLEEQIQEIEKPYPAELVEKNRELNLVNAELWKRANEAETLNFSLEKAHENSKQESLLELQLENELAFKKEISSLKNILEERERDICDLQQQVSSLEAAMTVKNYALEVLELKIKNHIDSIKELEAKNMDLNEKISGLVLHKNNLLVEMERVSNQFLDVCCFDETLLGSFNNPEYDLWIEISNNDEKNEAVSSYPSSTKLMCAKERLPFQEINY